MKTFTSQLSETRHRLYRRAHARRTVHVDTHAHVSSEHALSVPNHVLQVPFVEVNRSTFKTNVLQRARQARCMTRARKPLSWDRFCPCWAGRLGQN